MNDSQKLQETVFSASGVEKIIWVDDRFGVAAELVVSIDEVINDIEVKLLAGMENDLLHLEYFKNVNLDLTNTFWKSEVKDAIKESGLSLETISGQIGREEDYSDDFIEEIKDILNSVSRLETFSLSDWKKKHVDILNNSMNTLFLIDKDFDKEGGEVDEGVEIIKTIINKNADKDNNNYCVLFTHACSDRTESETLRQKWMQEYKRDNSITLLEPHSFTVLSKTGFNANDNFSLHDTILITLRDIFARKICAKITSNLKKNIFEAVNEVEEVVLDQNIYELDTAIFHNSLIEGASEVELLHRIFHQAQKSAAQRSLLDEENLTTQLVKLREISGVLLYEKNNRNNGSDKREIKNVKCVSDRLKDFREKEIWDDGDLINRVCSPLSNGDVFEAAGRKFVLIGQPCDLAVRGSDGLRNPYPGTLVELITANMDERDPISNKRKNAIEKEKKAKEKEIFFQIIDNPKDRVRYQYLDFRCSVPVNLDILDWCVYQRNGHVSIGKAHELDSMVFLEGWRKRFNQLVDILEESEKNLLPKSLSYTALTYQPLSKEQPVEFDPLWCEEKQMWDTGLKRVRRLRDPYAEHALMQYYSFRSRKAFAHDFTQIR